MAGSNQERSRNPFLRCARQSKKCDTDAIREQVSHILDFSTTFAFIEIKNENSLSFLIVDPVLDIVQCFCVWLLS